MAIVYLKEFGHGRGHLTHVWISKCHGGFETLTLTYPCRATTSILELCLGQGIKYLQETANVSDLGLPNTV